MIKKLFAFALLLTLSLISLVSPLSAAPAKTAPTYGIDISYPQCGRKIVGDQAFGIVGVNGGNPGNFNPCLREQLLWAGKSSGNVTGQAPVQVYINTSNPGDVQSQMTLTKWPTSTTTANPYYAQGCTAASESNQACSWQYGYERGATAVAHYRSQAPIGTIYDATLIPWWLDVELSTSWQGENDEVTTPENYDNNVATLEGWVKSLRDAGVKKVGLYSNTYLWKRITGNRISTTGTLYNLPTWYPIGPATVSAAQTACNSQKPLTAGGKIIMTQYVSKNLDYNYSCPVAAGYTWPAN